MAPRRAGRGAHAAVPPNWCPTPRPGRPRLWPAPLSGCARFRLCGDADLEAMRELALLVVRDGGRVDGTPAARPAGRCEASRREAAGATGGAEIVNVRVARSLPGKDVAHAALSGES